MAIKRRPRTPTSNASLRSRRERVPLALLDQDQLDGAVEALRPVLDAPPAHRPVPLIRRVLGFDRRLLAHSTAGSTPLGRELHDEITEFCGNPLTPRLPTA